MAIILALVFANPTPGPPGVTTATPLTRLTIRNAHWRPPTGKCDCQVQIEGKGDLAELKYDLRIKVYVGGKPFKLGTPIDLPLGRGEGRIEKGWLRE